jgi:hypothetical protein
LLRKGQRDELSSGYWTSLFFCRKEELFP